MRRGNVLAKAPLAALESLEARLLLSGQVSTTFAGGNLTITCDDDPNDITVVKVPGTNTVEVTGNDGETFVGWGQTIFNVTGHVRILMGGGDDAVTVGENGKTFRVGQAVGSPDDYPTNPLDLTVDLGAGDDDLTLIAVTARNMSIVGGAGDNAVTVRDNGDGTFPDDYSRAYGNFTFTNGNDGADVLLQGAFVVRHCSLTLGNGGGTVTLTTATASEATSVGGNLTITGGNLADTVDLDDLLVLGSVTVNLMGSPVGDPNVLEFGNAEVGGNFTFTGGGQDDRVQGTGADVEVGGSLALNLLGGANEADFDAASWLGAGRNFTYTGAGGDDDLDFGALGVGGHATFTLGAGTNALEFRSDGNDLCDITGNLTINGGTGTDAVRFLAGGGGFVGGSVLLNLSGGTNTLLFQDLWGQLAVGGAFTYLGGTGDDTLTWDEFSMDVHGNLALTLGAGVNTVEMSAGSAAPPILGGQGAGLENGLDGLPTEIGGNLIVTGGAGDDTVQFGPGDFLVRGSTTINLLSGVNTVLVGTVLPPIQGAGAALVLTGPTWFIVFGNLTYIGGASDDGFYQAGTLEVGGAMSVNAQAGANEVLLAGDDGESDDLSVVGNLTYTGGAGDDAVGSDGEVLVGGSASFNLAAGENLFDLGATVGGNFTYTGGAGTDDLDVGLEAGGSASFNLAAGENLFDLGATLGGNFTYTGGAGTDEVDAGLDVAGSASFNLGAGDNNVGLGATLGGNFTYTGGAGTDEVDAGMDVMGSASFNLGAGDNDLGLGAAIGGNFTYLGGGATDGVEVGLQAFGSASFNLGGGDNTLLFDEGVSVVGNLTVTGGAATDAVTFTALEPGDAVVGGNLSINLAGGTNTLDFLGGGVPLKLGAGAGLLLEESTGLLLVGGSFSYTGSTGDDTLTWDEFPFEVRGHMTLTLSGGANTVNMDVDSPALVLGGGQVAALNGYGGTGGLVAGNLTVTGGAGADSLVLDGEYFFIGGSATFNLLGGVNTLEFDGLFEIYGNLGYTGGANDDAIVQYGSMEVGGHLSMSVQGGANTFTFAGGEGWLGVVGNLTYTGGTGDDVLSGWWLEVGGSTSLNLSGGTNTFESTDGLDVGGHFAVTGGTGGDSVLLQEADVAGNVVMNLQGGANNVAVGQWLDVIGALVYTGGLDVDTLDLRQLSVTGATSINASGADNIVAIYEAQLRTLALTAGTGNDKVCLGDDAAQAGGWDPSQVWGGVSVNLGAGDDRLYVGYNTGDGFAAEFYDYVAFNGGAGANDLYDFEDTYFTFTPPALTNWEVP